MNYKFGMPTLIEKNSIIENVFLCKKLDLDFIELNMNLPYCMPENISSKELLEIKNEYDVGFTLHFPEDIDFGHFYEEVRQANIRLFRSIAIWASEFGVEKINIHLNPGIYFTLPTEKVFVYEKNKELFTARYLDSMTKIRDIAEPLGMKVCVENMQAHKFVEETYEKLSHVPGIYFTWDVGHDAMSDYKIKEIYLKNPNKVKHMHLHDYDGIRDHQVLFTGTVPIKERLKFAKENNSTVVIETKTVEALEESVKRLRTLKI